MGRGKGSGAGRPRIELPSKVELLKQGRSVKELAERYECSVDTIRRRLTQAASVRTSSARPEPIAAAPVSAVPADTPVPVSAPAVPPVDPDEEPKPPRLTMEQQAMLAERSKKYDPNATKQNCIDDLRYVQETHPNKFITRNFYRIWGQYSEKTWNRYFGTMEEFRSEAGLQLSRSQRHLEKHIAKHASLDEARKFYRLEVEPWVNKYAKFDQYRPDGTMKKVIAASDFHDIDVDLFVLEVFMDTCLVEQPDIIVLNGDIFDLYEFSHFDKDPRKINLRLRMEFVRDRIFKRLREVCPNAQIDLIIGNHEHRLLKHMASKTENMAALMELANVGLAELLGLDRYQINLISKGNTSAYILKEIREEMAKNFKVYFGCLVCNHTGDENFGLTTIGGHTHRPKMDGEVHLVKGPINKLTTGCMCKLDADYINSKNEWQNSFAIAYVDPVHERVQLQHVLFADPFVNVNGRYYFRNMDNAEIRCSAQVIDAIRTREIQGFVHRDEEAAIVAGVMPAVSSMIQ